MSRLNLLQLQLFWSSW